VYLDLLFLDMFLSLVYRFIWSSSSGKYCYQGFSRHERVVAAIYETGAC
jgi:hypothetical protein